MFAVSEGCHSSTLFGVLFIFPSFSASCPRVFNSPVWWSFRVVLRWTVSLRATIAGRWRSLALWPRWTWASACLTWRTTCWGRSLMPSSTTSRRSRKSCTTCLFEALSRPATPNLLLTPSHIGGTLRVVSQYFFIFHFFQSFWIKGGKSFHSIRHLCFSNGT